MADMKQSRKFSRNWRRKDNITSDAELLSNIEAFHHEPLQLDKPTIRVISILPGASQSTIRCKLWHIELADDVHTCLSYTWGDEADQQLIKINDKVFRVRQNLYQFLKQARQLGIQQPLWIDAVCIYIDQS